jgi:predicted nucleic acid-binding protein
LILVKKTLFVDTGAWYAVADTSDQYHRYRQAIDIYPTLLRIYHDLTTNNLVVAETYTLIRRNLGHQAAITFLEKISASPRMIKLYSERTLDESAVNTLRQHEDQNFTYTDAVNFSVMQDLGIKEAFSFDRHFEIAGFVMIPGGGAR